MSLPRFGSEMFYSVQPGDTIEKIIKTTPAVFGKLDLAREIQRLTQLNGHLDLRRLQPGDLLLLGFGKQVNPFAPRLPVATLREMNSVWKAASPETRRTYQENFDVLNFFLTPVGWEKNSVEAAHKSGEALEATLRKVPEFKFKMSTVDELTVTARMREMVSIRADKVTLLRSLGVSVKRSPIVIIDAVPNALYSSSQTFLQAVEAAKRYNLGKKLFKLDLLLEGIQVGETALTTGFTSKETGQALFKGSAKIASSTLITGAVTQFCTWAIPASGVGAPITAVGCVLGIGYSTFKSSAAGEKFSNWLFKEEKLHALP